LSPAPRPPVCGTPNSDASPPIGFRSNFFFSFALRHAPRRRRRHHLHVSKKKNLLLVSAAIVAAVLSFGALREGI
jgi:hypothetical protein